MKIVHHTRTSTTSTSTSRGIPVINECVHTVYTDTLSSIRRRRRVRSAWRPDPRGTARSRDLRPAASMRPPPRRARAARARRRGCAQDRSCSPSVPSELSWMRATPTSSVNEGPSTAGQAIKQLLLPLYLPCFFDSVSMGIIGPVLPLFVLSLGATEAITGIVVSTVAAGRLSFSMPGGQLVGRVGEKRAIQFGLLVYSAQAWQHLTPLNEPLC